MKKNLVRTSEMYTLFTLGCTASEFMVATSLDPTIASIKNADKELVFNVGLGDDGLSTFAISFEEPQNKNAVPYVYFKTQQVAERLHAGSKEVLAAQLQAINAHLNAISKAVKKAVKDVAAVPNLALPEDAANE